MAKCLQYLFGSQYSVGRSGTTKRVLRLPRGFYFSLSSSLRKAHVSFRVSGVGVLHPGARGVLSTAGLLSRVCFSAAAVEAEEVEPAPPALPAPAMLLASICSCSTSLALFCLCPPLLLLLEAGSISPARHQSGRQIPNL